MCSLCTDGSVNYLFFLLIYIDGEPRDGVAKNVTVSVHLGTTVLFAVLATAGIVFTAICLIFTFYFREKKYGKI